MPTLKSQTTDAQRADYIELSLTMDHLLARTISLLTTRRDLIKDRNEIVTIDVEITGLEAEQAKIFAELTAFLAERASINPPTKEQFDLINKNSATLDVMIANSETANSILAVATAAAKEFRKTSAA